MRALLLVAALAAGAAVSLAPGEARATDGELKLRVQEGLIHWTYLHAGWVRVRCDGATVTLVGRVPDELIHALVVLGVRNVAGVAVVKDRLTVDGSLERWRPTPVENTRQRLENARRILRGDETLGAYTTLHVARNRTGLVVTGDVSTGEERLRIRKLLEAPGVGVAVHARARPDATRRADVRDAGDTATRAFARSVSDAIAREPLLAGRVSVTARVERGALLLRGTARDLPAHDLAVEIARAALLARQRAAERARARSGELTRLLAGDPGTIEGEVPASLESFVVVDAPT